MKEKHEWKKIKNKYYLNYSCDPEHHHIMYNEYYECQECGAVKEIEK